MKIDILWIDTAVCRIQPICELSGYRRNKPPSEVGLAAECLLQRLLVKSGIKLPCEILTDHNGKPYIKGKPLHFSISHTGSIALCAVCECKIGADIQRPQLPSLALLDRYFTAVEREYIDEALDKAAAFARLWSAKESYVKATGQGIARGLKNAGLEIVNSDSAYCNGYRIYMHTLADALFSCCALTKEGCELEIHEFSD